MLDKRYGAERHNKVRQVMRDACEVVDCPVCVTRMQQCQVGTICTSRTPQDESPQFPEFVCTLGRAKQHAAIRQFLRLSKLHGDGEGLQVLKSLGEMRQAGQFILPAQRDVCGNKAVLYWVKPLPDWLDKQSLRLREEKAELASCRP